ncbi:MAG: hypothetical protein KJS97_07165 [Alphaproteobacteria bacterium]|nr:hypothetical protein [Alphaproteobacteria bacterium]
MLVLGSLGVFLLATAGIVFFSVQSIGWLGKAMNPRRPRDLRLRAGAVAAASALALVASGAGGFLGITSLWYVAQTKAQAEAPR